MYTFLSILILIVAILLIAVVLIQPGKGDMVTGLGTIGGSMSSMFGSRRAADMLQKITVGLAISLFVLVIVTNLFFVGAKNIEAAKPITEGAVNTRAIPAAPVTPSVPAPTQQQQPQQEEKK